MMMMIMIMLMLMMIVVKSRHCRENRGSLPARIETKMCCAREEYGGETVMLIYAVICNREFE